VFANKILISKQTIKMSKAYSIRLDSAATPEQTSVRRELLVQLLADHSSEYLAVQENKGKSKQVHWQAIAYTDKPKNVFLNAFRKAHCNKTEYTCVVTRKIDEYTRYLCKGQDDARASEVIVLCMKGKYDTETITREHNRWFDINESLRIAAPPRTKERINLMEACIEEISASGKEFSPSLCMSTVFKYCLRMNKMLGRTTQIWIAQMIMCKHDPDYEQRMLESMTDQFMCDFSLMPSKAKKDAYRVQKALEADLRSTQEVPSDDPIDSGVKTTIFKEKQEIYDQQAGEDWRQGDPCRRFVYPEFPYCREEAGQDSQSSLEDHRSEQDSPGTSISQIQSFRWIQGNAGDGECFQRSPGDIHAPYASLRTDQHQQCAEYYSDRNESVSAS